MNLYIVRHAWAGEHGDPRYPNDGLRPLTEDGRARFKKLAKALVKRGCEPEVVATSPLVRCRQTAEILVAAAGGEAQLVELEALAPDSDLEELVAWTKAQQAGSVAWVGHAPDVGRLAAAMIGDRTAEIRFAKGAVACIDLPDECAAGAGMLVWLVTAKALGV
jgi:phosphohistidine phosphatase